jgi:uncharacterized membrane protein
VQHVTLKSSNGQFEKHKLIGHWRISVCALLDVDLNCLLQQVERLMAILEDGRVLAVMVSHLR